MAAVVDGAEVERIECEVWSGGAWNAVVNVDFLSCEDGLAAEFTGSVAVACDDLGADGEPRLRGVERVRNLCRPPHQNGISSSSSRSSGVGFRSAILAPGHWSLTAATVLP